MGRFLDSLSKRPFLFLGGACATLFFLPLNLRALWDPYEGQLAEMAREMLELGDWITPHLHYTATLKEPPLMSWVTALSLALFGPSAWAARFSCALFGLLTVWVTYRMGKNWKGERTGLLAAVILATSLGFFIYTQFLTAYTAFTFWTSVILLAQAGLLVDRSVHRIRRFVYLLAMAIAGGVLTKGFVALVLPAVAFVIVYTTQGRRLPASRIPWKAGVILAVLLILPWFFWVRVRNPGFFGEFFAHSPFGWDFADLSADKPFYYYVPALIVGFVPWVVFMPKVIATWMTRRRAVFQRDPERALWVTWSSVVFVFFSLAHEKHLGLILPIFPALALLIAAEFDDALNAAESERRAIMPGWVGAGLAFLVAIFFLGLVFLKVQPEVLSMASPGWSAVFSQSGLLAVVLGIGIFIFVGVWGMRQTLACLGGVMLVQVLLLTSAASLAPELDPFQSSLQVATHLRSRATPGEMIAIHGLGDRASSLEFYLRRMFIFQLTHTPQDVIDLPMGAWGVTDFEHWQSLREAAPGTFQLAQESGRLMLFRKER